MERRAGTASWSHPRSSRKYFRTWEPCTCLPWSEQQYSSRALCTLMVWGWWHAWLLLDFRKAASSLRLCSEVCQKNSSSAARNKKLLAKARKGEAGTKLEDVFSSSAFGLDGDECLGSSLHEEKRRSTQSLILLQLWITKA